MVKIKRAYEPESKADGYRVLIDRLWPRGIRKSDLKLDQWLKELAPTTELRKSFGHDPTKWDDFRKEYRKQLRSPEALRCLEDLAGRARNSVLTLIYAARDESHNDAVVLKQVLDSALTSTANAPTRKKRERGSAKVSNAKRPSRQ